MSDFTPQNPWAILPSDPFANDVFLVNRQLFRMNKYELLDAAERPILYADRPALRLISHIGVYADSAKTQKILDINQDGITILNDSYTVVDTTGRTIGFLKRRGWMSLLRRTWHIQDASGQDVAVVQEDSLWKAVIRRTPYLNVVGAFFRTNYIISRPGAIEPLGEFIRAYSLQDKHRLDLTRDTQRTLDRRLAVALGIVLDNVERRHSNEG